MRRIANILVRLANWLYPQAEQKNGYVARQFGIGIHISKNDVKKFRKLNPQYDSHRKALSALIEDCKEKAIFNIVAGLKDKGIVEYEVKKTLYVADVKAVLKVYVPEKKAE